MHLDKRYSISIEGNIGAGKTLLAKKISEILNATLILENFEDNPFLPYFYKNMEEYSLPLELVFLTERIQQLRKYSSPSIFNNWIIADYTIYKSFIFGRVTLKEWKFELFRKIFNLLAPTAPQVDLILYIHREVPTLIKNIKERGRPFEDNITPEYLFAIEESYLNFFQFNYKKTLLNVIAKDKDLLQPNTIQNIINAIKMALKEKKSLTIEI